MKKCSARSTAFVGALMKMAMKFLALGVAVQSDVQGVVGLKLTQKMFLLSD